MLGTNYVGNVEKGRAENVHASVHDVVQPLHENIMEVEWRYWNYVARCVLNQAYCEQPPPLICDVN